MILLMLLNDILPAKKELRLCFVAAAFVANLLLENIVHERYNELRIGGKARALLRTALLNVSIQLQLREQEQFTGGEVMNIMGAGVETVISMVWANFFSLVQVAQRATSCLFSVRAQASTLTSHASMLTSCFHCGCESKCTHSSFAHTMNDFVLLGNGSPA